MRTLGNASAQIDGVLDDLAATAVEYGYKGATDFNAMANWANIIENAYGLTKGGSLQGRVKSGIQQAGEAGVAAATGGIGGVLLKAGQAVAGQTNKNKQKALDQLIDFLHKSDDLPKAPAGKAGGVNVPEADIVGDVTTSISKAKEAVTSKTTFTDTVKNSSILASKIKEINEGKIFGHTLNLDGTDYIGKDAIPTIRSKTLTFEEATPERINQELIKADRIVQENKHIKIGVFKMESGEGVSIDINIATPNRKLAERIARLNNQESYWDAEIKATVQTGGTGVQVFSDKQIQKVLEILDDPDWEKVLTERGLLK
ncbi:MAG: hypothetical protein Q8P30_02820 [Candidatus Uhrbacteria bacterium]|nr:hypothetical protein [Candidatus Uhrbacteria bacterium]